MIAGAQPHETAPRTTDEHRSDERARDADTSYLRYRDGDDFHCVPLDVLAAPLYIGRHLDSHIRVRCDPHVSGRHVRLLFGGGAWSLEDAGSTNGTLLNGKPLVSEQRLVVEDLIEIGSTLLSFHEPAGTELVGTVTLQAATAQRLAPTSTQRRVLVELARPWFEPTQGVPVAPTNADIARTLAYSPATVRDAISDLYRQAGLERGAVNQRGSLIALAIRTRVVSPVDYQSPTGT